jgi:membrane-bound lytic murein transglycosylase D
LLAIADLVGNPGAFGVTLPELPNEPRFAVVETGGQIDMALAAELAGLETDALYALNPGVNRWATDPDGPHRLLLPMEHAPAFTTALASLGPRERVQWTRHRVKAGETIGGIAERYQTTLAVLRQVNGLRGNTIRAGDYLMIPTATRSLAAYTQSADSRAARQQSTARSGERRTHVVQSGESLWSISQAYGVGLRNLASWNAMAPGDTLGVGRELVVWTPASSEATAASAGAAPVTTTTAQASLIGSDSSAGFVATNRMREITYVVRRGDSLSSIARRFKVTVDKLVEWNSGAADKYLQPGQRLKMVVDVTAQSG